MMNKAIFCILLSATLGALTQQPQSVPASSAAPRTFTISGTAVDAVTGSPVANASISIAPAPAPFTAGQAFPAAPPEDLSSLLTDENGKFRFISLQPGKYRLLARRKGYLVEALDQHDQLSSAVAVGPGLDSDDIVFPMHPQASIQGRVVDEANEPVRNAMVYLFLDGNLFGTSGMHRLSQIMTNDEGAYHFNHLRPGKYLVAVDATPWYSPAGMSDELPGIGRTSRPGRQGASENDDRPNPALDVAYPVTYYAGATDPDAASPLVIEAGEATTADFLLQPVPAVHVRIRVASSQDTRIGTLLQPMVFGTVVPVASTFIQSVSPGVFEISEAPGQYVLRTFSNRGQDSQQQSREVDIADSTTLDASDIPKAAPVNVTVRTDDASPVPNRARVQLIDANRRGMARFAEINGKPETSFAGGVPPGDYQITLGGVAGTVIRSLSAAGARLNGRVLHISGSAPVQLALTLSHGFSRIQGVVLRDGKPISGIMVVLVPADPANNAVLFRRDQSDTDGSFTLTALPGKYTLLALKNGWDLEWTNPQVLKPYMARGLPLDVDGKKNYSLKVNPQ